MATKKGKSSHVAWRLEAFDLRAGMAFATYREEQSSAQAASDWPCLYFAPPGFTAEPVDNIAAALAATRGTFDSNMLVNGREASFETPDEVAEFVRRAYVSSAGGDGADGPGGGGEPPQPPNPEGPSDPPPDSTRTDSGAQQPSATWSLLRSVDAFNESIRHCPDGESFKAVWNIDAHAPMVGALAAGAALLMREMLDRLPQARDLEAQYKWTANAQSLGDAITGLGLWHELLNRYDSRLLVNRLQMPKGWLPNRGEARVPAHVLFFTPHAMPDDPSPYRYLVGPRQRAIEVLPAQRAAADPFECLAQWPVPHFASQMIPVDALHEASVAHFLAAFMSCPSGIRNSTSSPARVLDVVLFTCAYLANWRLRQIPNATSPLGLAAIDERGRMGMRWLIEQLPSRGFSVGYEAVLADARNRRYRAMHR